MNFGQISRNPLIIVQLSFEGWGLFWPSRLTLRLACLPAACLRKSTETCENQHVYEVFDRLASRLGPPPAPFRLVRKIRGFAPWEHNKYRFGRGFGPKNAAKPSENTFFAGETSYFTSPKAILNGIFRSGRPKNTWFLRSFTLSRGQKSMLRAS